MKINTYRNSPADPEGDLDNKNKNVSKNKKYVTQVFLKLTLCYLVIIKIVFIFGNRFCDDTDGKLKHDKAILQHNS